MNGTERVNGTEAANGSAARPSGVRSFLISLVLPVFRFGWVFRYALTCGVELGESCHAV